MIVPLGRRPTLIFHPCLPDWIWISWTVFLFWIERDKMLVAVPEMNERYYKGVRLYRRYSVQGQVWHNIISYIIQQIPNWVWLIGLVLRFHTATVITHH